ncbi:8-oxo-dGTP pyrophosphatase MutT (NUDIX family) [Pontibacter ummariensis]|uniref:GDP-mannose pyrophosphatase n=1 Tax=Pontibacter ummariensis TaxID=1610492 RepID=A0A239E7K8_9BACT|nr:NUDIX hydrolase [Pontibacter ummariensis]PRY13117.1 8-oxo-dGTP pyrophosphatase MutT (NUDIX family) [Pontibacter ummariensis]SNS40449.1 8-oxo-dGTP pyrophosphatase MutT, NUDIX family [Pontibacter ummariensis]
MPDEQHNPWTTLSSKDIYQNPWIRVREDQVLNPKGGEGIYGVVSMRNKAIGIIPIDDEGYTYLIGQYRYPLNEYSWEIPMGGGPMEDDILDSAKRELKEETGFTAAKWTNICRLHTSNSVTDEEGFVFLAQELTSGETAFEETEELHIKRVPFEEAVRMAMNNEITDAISVAGILKAALLLRREA